MSASTPAIGELANSSTNNVHAQISKITGDSNPPTLSPKAGEKGGAPALKRGEKGGAPEPVVLSSRERKRMEQQEKEAAAREKLANAKPDIVLFTTAGHKLVLPSKD